MATRERSPNYPGVGLDSAVEMLRKLYQNEHRSAVPVEVAARALGYSGVSQKGRLSGAAIAKLAALRQYGLIDNASKGKVKVSDLALDLVLHGPDEPEFQNAVRAAALTPPLYRELYDEYAKASDNALRAHLIKERKFSEDGALRLIKAFRDTIAFAKLTEESYNNPGGKPGEQGGRPNADPPGATPNPSARNHQNPLPKGRSVAYSWPLGDGAKVELTFTEEPTQKQLDILMAQLKIVRDISPATRPTKAEEGAE